MGSDSLYLTITLPDVKDETVDLTDTGLKFQGTSNSQIFEVNITFYKSVNAKDSTYKIHPRSVQMHIVKSKHDDNEASKVVTDDNLFWPRLLQNKLLEKNQVNIDWDQYIDEDEEGDKGGLDDYGDMRDMDSADEEEDKEEDDKSNNGNDKD